MGRLVNTDQIREALLRTGVFSKEDVKTIMEIVGSVHSISPIVNCINCEYFEGGQYCGFWHIGSMQPADFCKQGIERKERKERDRSRREPVRRIETYLDETDSSEKPLGKKSVSGSAYTKRPVLSEKRADANTKDPARKSPYTGKRTYTEQRGSKEGRDDTNRSSNENSYDKKIVSYKRNMRNAYHEAGERYDKPSKPYQKREPGRERQDRGPFEDNAGSAGRF